MLNILFFFICYFLILISIIGYGSLINSKEKNLPSLGFLGLKGLFILIILSYFTNFLTPHNLIHNTVITIVK